jgi:MoxR-like ATPase
MAKSRKPMTQNESIPPTNNTRIATFAEPEPPNGHSPQPKFLRIRDALNASLVERTDEIDLALVAVIARQHVLLVGPPGTAKTLMVDALKDWVTGSRKCVLHCNKDTSRNAAFGPVKLSALKVDKMERVLDGGAADAHFLVLEEVFKAGPAVLDMFLLLMSDRVYKEGVFGAAAPLRTVFAVSNEWSPEGCEAALAAFFDRFLLRKTVDPIRTKAGRRSLLAKAVSNDDCRPVLTETITLTELDQAHTEAMALPWSPQAKKALWAILETLDQEGVKPGDRRVKWSVGVARAAAYLAGASQVLSEHLEVLQHCLWVDPGEQPRVVAKVVRKIANPTGAAITECLLKADDVQTKCKPSEAQPKLEAVAAELAGVAGADVGMAKAYLDRQDGAKFLGLIQVTGNTKVLVAAQQVLGMIADNYNRLMGRASMNQEDE